MYEMSEYGMRSEILCLSIFQIQILWVQRGVVRLGDSV